MAEWIEQEKVAPSWLGFLIARCSKCGKYVCTPTTNNEYFQYKYCPHCGEPVHFGKPVKREVDERHVEDENNEKKESEQGS